MFDLSFLKIILSKEERSFEIYLVPGGTLEDLYAFFNKDYHAKIYFKNVKDTKSNYYFMFYTLLGSTLKKGERINGNV